MYMIVHEKSNRPEFRYVYYSACNRAQALSKVYHDTATVYQIKLDGNNAQLVEEAEYVNGEKRVLEV